MKPVSMKHLQLLGVICVSITTLAALAEPQHASRAASLIERFDSNGDGTLSMDEFEPPKRMKRHEKVRAADANGDGATSREEWLSAVQRKHERASKQFDEMDINGDNVLSDSEMREAMFQSIDDNNDGQLSADELNRLHERRHNRKHEDDHKHSDNHKHRDNHEHAHDHEHGDGHEHGHGHEHGEDRHSSAG